MKMIAGAILCLAGVELVKGVGVSGSIGALIYLVGSSFLFLTGFGYVVLGAKEKKNAQG